ncbi:MAG TPA: hypothetical protein VJP58_10920, partial [Candidatus Nitrosocosmicus sp.]|nr:hypothetical protein [Candidatus Nitrosocosmicus sp.]
MVFRFEKEIVFEMREGKRREERRSHYLNKNTSLVLSYRKIYSNFNIYINIKIIMIKRLGIIFSGL